MRSIYVDVAKLDRTQQRVYAQKIDSCYIVSGCAGSGKTSLALLRMQHILSGIDESTRGASPLYYISFVRNFIECIRNELTNLNLGEPESKRVVKFTDYMISMWNWENGFITPHQVKTYHIQYPESERMKIESGVHQGDSIRVNHKPSYLLVDECQDLTSKDVSDLIHSGAKISFYGDSNQSIMDFSIHDQADERKTLSLDDIKNLVSAEYGDCTIFQLGYNYRLSKSIAQFAQEIYGDNLEVRCKQDSGERPIVVQTESFDDAVMYISSRMANLSDVGIGVFTNEMVENLYDKMCRKVSQDDISCRYTNRNDYREINEASKIKIMDFENIKGRQFEAVFIYIEKENLDEKDVRRLYVGITRAEKKLYILHSCLMPNVLRNVPKCLYETTDDISSEIMF